jgi:hypothetical protein
MEWDNAQYKLVRELSIIVVVIMDRSSGKGGDLGKGCHRRELHE